MSEAYKVAYNTWQEKTDWVQTDRRFDVLLPLGKHRADVLKEYIEHLESHIDDMAVQLANSESKCRELAADNGALKKFCKDAAFDADYEAELGMDRGGFTDALNDIKTPATDSFLAEVQAQGVDAAMEHMQSSGSLTFGDCYISLNELAAQLRKGAAL